MIVAVEVRDTVQANSMPTYSRNEEASSTFAEQIEDPHTRPPEAEAVR